MGQVKYRPLYGMPLLAQLDIGNDNKLEIDADLANTSVQRTFNLGTGAVDIRIVTGARLQNRNSSYNFEVGLTLNPDAPLKISSYGPMCGLKLGVTSTVSGAGHSITCVVAGGFVSRGAGLWFGLQPAAIPLPGTFCSLLITPLLGIGKPDVGGTTTFVFDVPSRIDGLVHLQAMSTHSAFGLTSVRMSNGVKVDGR
jgi:hypothetical protein